ncbi:sensor histidine kinase [Eisenibacter elegans]|uniref:ATP-binding protein n=1 Tax=Eisenibacter elegans TaxID=997 RepID=UPI0004199060|nr:HAMP domain-containing sensor histidine kinase [Eisenibacter elegans]
MFRRFQSLRHQFLLTFLVFNLILGLIALIGWWLYQRDLKAMQRFQTLEHTLLELVHLIYTEHHLLYATNDTDEQPSLTQLRSRRLRFEQLQQNLDSTCSSTVAIGKPWGALCDSIQQLKTSLQTYDSLFITAYNRRQLPQNFLTDQGLEAAMYRQIRQWPTQQAATETQQRLLIYFLTHHDSLVPSLKSDLEALAPSIQAHRQALHTLDSLQQAYNQHQSPLALSTAQQKQTSERLFRFASQLHELAEAQKQRLFYTFLLILGISAVFCTAVVYGFSSRLVGIMLRLSETIQQIVRETFGKALPSPAKSENEVRQLMQVFYGMINEVRQQLEEIRETTQAMELQNEELNQINQHISASEERMRRLNNVKDRFFSIISHDLRSPLRSLLGFTDLIRHHAATLEPPQLELLATNLEKDVKRVLDLLENLLNWSLSQTEEIDFKPETVGLSQIIAENTALYEQGAQEKKISLVLQLDNIAQTKVWADANMLAFVVRNLVSNALKFTNPEGEVRVTAQISTEEVRVSVWDNGIGISPEELEKLLHSDKHISTPGTAQEKGTGFGLLLCKDFVQRNGGQLSIQSKTAQGTEVAFTIPLALHQATTDTNLGRQKP